jgi:hypothetical protein
MTEKKKWTLMFYFASDNPLSSSMVSQVKAIKDAGYQLDTNVVVYFDPHEFGVPTRIFDVNQKKRDAATVSKVGDGNDPFVRNMIADKVDINAIAARPGSSTDILAKKLQIVDQISAKEALTHFLGFCRENYEAEHYMLFLMGHGMIVASDDFLPDDNPMFGITLVELGDLLRGFANDIKGSGELELIGMSSCSMSAIEVVYQLKGTANYMLASQGFSFVGSWPYRQLLKKTFNVIEEYGDNVDTEKLMKKLSQLCVHGSTDFMVMGYAADACLCKLTEQDVAKLNKPLTDLVGTLKEGLAVQRVKELILLAHLKSQSFWQENYTDLFDFCLCLGRSCSAGNDMQGRLKTACEKLMESLAAPFVYSDHFGSINQYSHGLSVYFPWTLPVEKPGGAKLATYQDYLFTKDLKPNDWLSFLTSYWAATMRDRRRVEDGVDESVTEEIRAKSNRLDISVGNAFNFIASSDINKPDPTLGGPKPDPTLGGTKPDPTMGGTKPDPTVGQGSDYASTSIKNYPNWPFYSDGVGAVFEDMD